MIKNQDILTLLILIDRQGQDVSLKAIGELSGVAVSQAFDSVERLKSVGLLDKQKKVQFSLVEKFLSEALAFALPGEIRGAGVGIKLPISEVATLVPVSSVHSLCWVWPSEKSNSPGILISPVAENLEEFISAHPWAADVLACIEILRFHEHANRHKAIVKIRHWLHGKSGPTSRAHSSESATQILEQVSKVAAEMGFRNMTLESLAQSAGVSLKELTQHFDSVESLQKAIGEACASRAFAHFGQLLMKSSEKESLNADSARKSLTEFFDFLDHNEDYFRLGLWFYVERTFDRPGEPGVLKDHFFELLESSFERIPSARSKEARAVLFANSWLTYAWFRWVEFPRMENRTAANLRLLALKQTLVETLI